METAAGEAARLMGRALKEPLSAGDRCTQTRQSEERAHLVVCDLRVQLPRALHHLLQPPPGFRAPGLIRPPARLSTRCSDLDATTTKPPTSVDKVTAAMAHGPTRAPAWLSASAGECQSVLLIIPVFLADIVSDTLVHALLYSLATTSGVKCSFMFWRSNGLQRRHQY